MKPKLLESTYFVPIERGIFFRGNQGVLVMEGAGTYAWFERLVPFLNGRYTLDQLRRSLSPSQWEAVESILGQLAEKGFLRFLKDEEEGRALTEPLLQTYASQLALIESYHDSPAEHFAAFRATRLLVIGSGLPLLATLRAGLENGLGHQIFTCVAEPWRFQDRLEEILQACRKKDPDLQVSPAGAPERPDEVEGWMEHIRPFEVILALSDPVQQDWMRALSRAAKEVGRTLIPAAGYPEGWVVGPLWASPTDPCWSCFEERWRRSAEPSSSDGGQGGPIGAALAGAVLIFELFKLQTGIRKPETQEAILEISRDSWEIQRRVLLPVAFCPACSSDAWRKPEEASSFLSSLRRDASSDEVGRLVEEVLRWMVDPKVGLLSSLDEEDLEQVPYFRCAATVRRSGSGADGAGLRVVGAARTPLEARAAAARGALEAYVTDRIEARDGEDLWSYRVGTGLSPERSSSLAEPDGAWAEVVSGTTLDQLLAEGFLRTVGRWQDPRGGWQPWAPSREQLASVEVLARYLDESDAGWAAEKVELETVTSVRFLKDQRVVAVVSGFDLEKILEAGLKEVWLSVSSQEREQRPKQFRAAVGSGELGEHDIVRISSALNLKCSFSPLSLPETQRLSALCFGRFVLTPTEGEPYEVEVIEKARVSARQRD